MLEAEGATVANEQAVIGVRVPTGLRDRIKAEADRNFGGNESLVIRKGTDLYLRLRSRLGPQFEPTIALWLGDDAEDRQAA